MKLTLLAIFAAGAVGAPIADPQMTSVPPGLPSGFPSGFPSFSGRNHAIVPGTDWRIPAVSHRRIPLWPNAIVSYADWRISSFSFWRLSFWPSAVVPYADWRISGLSFWRLSQRSHAVVPHADWNARFSFRRLSQRSNAVNAHADGIIPGDAVAEYGLVLFRTLNRHGETVNNLIGTTLNPVNRNLPVAALQQGRGLFKRFRGVWLDWVQILVDPLSYCRVANVISGETTYPSVGILATSLDAIHLVFSSLAATQPWLRDPFLAPVPWRQHLVDETLAGATADGAVNDQKPLKLGIYWTDDVVTPQPPIARGLRTVRTAKRVHLAFLKADGGHDIHKQLSLSGEPLIPPLRATFQLRDTLSLITHQELTVEGRDYEGAYSDDWNSTAGQDGQLVDAVAMPVAPHAAVIPGKFYHTAYTEAINLLDYSVIVIPVTKADQSIDKANPNYKPLNDVDAKNWKAYDAAVYGGAPVGVQVVARRFEEEKV
ncbi:amidase signature enzyme [Trematosphaeria pertusa]|uniref:Amidase signature enzyme n=1 Tax=Trematosphaeria pertusa TaxID=390896 RepID=A0A6A6IJX4_9PLEO|nr:amidase signature enzyme [Trematosphaeria pertusa]KAF2249813.1 amidase signature enzyme [Trematosphaeria pertusa]